MESKNLSLKRTNEKEGENELLSSKKTKTDHPESSSQSSFIKPTRAKSLNQNVLDGLAGFKKKPPVDMEPIVLSSDDEEEINMHKSALAKSLNVTTPSTAAAAATTTPTTAAATGSSSLKEKVKEADKVKLNHSSGATPTVVSTVTPTVTPAATSTTTSTNTTASTPVIIDAPSSIPTPPTSTPTLTPTITPTVTPTTTPAITPTVTPAVVQVPKPIAPATVTMSITVPNVVKQSPTKIADTPVSVVAVEETPAVQNTTTRAPEVTFLDSSDEDEDDEVEIEIEDKPEENAKETDTPADSVSVVSSVADPMETTVDSPSNTALTDNMSEVDELLSDSDADTGGGGDETKNDPQTVELLDIETKDVNQQRTRPVRQTNTRITTYNDIANSVDPITLTYNSSSDDDEPKTITAVAPTKKPKKRPSPPKLARPAAILNAFTRDLTDRRHLKTGFVYDTAMSYHATPNPMEIHPEDPRRIFKIFNILDKHGLLRECERINSRRATKQEILLAHNIIHYRKMRETAALKSRSDYMAMENDYDSIYLNSNSFESGLYAVGSLIELMEAVILDKVKNAFAIIRPPGHHAEADMAMGFCLFNNVAIATRDAMKRLKVKKTLIVDWDVHFGNGTQEIFSEDPDVLYVSLHRYEDGSFYPSDNKGRAEYTGHGAGVGKTVNIPWPCAGMTDADYLYAFREVIIPIAMEFAPDVVVVSAGFDAAINDPIGKCNVTPAGYGHMTHMLKSIAHGKLVIALEGGYDLNSIAVSALACMNVLLGESPEPIASELLPKQECIDTINNVKNVQQEHWACLN